MITAISIIAGLVWGALAAWLNSCITRKMLSKDTTNGVMLGSMLRSAVDIAALAVIFLVRNILPINYVYTLIAAAVSMSVITVAMSYRISKEVGK